MITDPKGLQKLQKESRQISKFYKNLRKNEFPNQIIDPEYKSYIRKRSKFKIEDKLLKRLVNNKYVLVLPTTFINDLYLHYHVNGGHFSAEKTHRNISEKYYIFGLLDQLRLLISRCKTCQAYDKRGIGNAQPIQIKASRAGEKLFLDVIGKLNRESSEGYSYCLVGIDCFSRFAVAQGVPDVKGSTILWALKLMYIFKYSFPSQIATDNGLDSPELREFCEMNSIKLTFIAVYNPRANLTERLNQSVKKILYKLWNDNSREWDEITLAMAVFFYNIAIHSTTEFSPHFIFLCQKPAIPLDLMLGTVNGEFETQEQYLDELRKSIALVPEKAYEAFSKSFNLSGMRRFNRNTEYVAGQKILVRNFRKTSKFDPNYLSDFEIIKRVGQGTYLVRNNRTKRYSKINVRDFKADGNHLENLDTPDEPDPANEIENESADDMPEGETLDESGIEGSVQDKTDEIDKQPEAPVIGLSGEGQITRAGRVTRPPQRFGTD